MNESTSSSTFYTEAKLEFNASTTPADSHWGLKFINGKSNRKVPLLPRLPAKNENLQNSVRGVLNNPVILFCRSERQAPPGLVA